MLSKKKQQKGPQMIKSKWEINKKWLIEKV